MYTLNDPMKTDRIELVPIEKSDFELFQEINVDPFVRRYLWDDIIMTADVFLQILDNVELHFKKDRWGLWKIQLTSTSIVIGYVGLWLFFDEYQPQLLYALLPEYTGKGYATESAKLVEHYAFHELKFRHLIATMDKANTASQKVCGRLGFKLVEEREVEGKPIVFYKLVNSDQ